MGDNGFTFDNILSPEEADKFFEQIETNEQQEELADPVEETNNENAEEDANTSPSEKVGDSEEITGNEEDTDDTQDDGSSPTVLSSIAAALKKDGILPDFSDDEISAVKTAEDFAELFEKAISQRVDADVRAVKEALDNGVPADTINKYKQILAELNAYTADDVSAEGEEGEKIRKYLIYNDLLSRGYSKEKAQKELKKSFDANMDIEDAQDALESLKTKYNNEYNKVLEDAKKAANDAEANRKKMSEDFKKMILDDELKVGNTSLDKKTCQKVFDAVSKPIYKDPDTGKQLTAVQKFQKDNPLEFLKQLGIWFVLTDGGKNMTALTKKQMQAEKNKGIKELERKLASTQFGGGSMRFDGGSSLDDGVDLLSDDGWKIA